jgi:hypothetical protein
MALGEVRYFDVDWIDLAQDKGHWRALVIAVMSLRFPQNAGKLLVGCTSGGLSNVAQLHS